MVSLVSINIEMFLYTDTSGCLRQIRGDKVREVFMRVQPDACACIRYVAIFGNQVSLVLILIPPSSCLKLEI